MQTTFTTTATATKQVAVRWPEEFWAIVSKAAIDRRTTLTGLITEAVAEKLGIPCPEKP